MSNYFNDEPMSAFRDNKQYISNAQLITKLNPVYQQKETEKEEQDNDLLIVNPKLDEDEEGSDPTLTGFTGNSNK